MAAPYSVDRGWATGEAKTVTLSGQLICHFCGGTFVKTDPSDYADCSMPYDSGWILGDTFVPFTRHCDFGPGFNGGHKIVLQAFGSTLSILVGGVDRDVVGPPYDPSENHYAWRTSLFHNGTLVNHYDDPADPGLISTTPETITGDFSVTFTVEEWIFETDLFDFPPHGGEGARPADPFSSRLTVAWKITSDITSVFSGHTITIPQASGDGTWSQIGYDTPDNPSGIRYLDPTFSAYAYFTGTSDDRGKQGAIYDLLPEADGKDGIPFGTVLSEVKFGSTDGPFDAFTSTDAWVSTGADPCGTPGITGKIRNYSLGENRTSFVFSQLSPPFSPEGYTLSPRTGFNPDYAQNWTAHHFQNITLNATVRDWEKNVSNFPVKIENVAQLICDNLTYAEKILPATGSEHFRVGILNTPEVDLSLHSDYGGFPETPAYLEYGPAWNALKVDHAATLVAEDFLKVNVVNGWNGTGTGAITHTDSLEVAGVSSGYIEKTLKSDYVDMVDDPAAWWTAHRNSLNALPGTVQTNAKIWGDETQQFYRIGRKMLAGSDVFNWSAYRYADLRVKASASCTINLIVTFREYEVTAEPDNSFLVHDYQYSYPINLTTTVSNIEIDLISRPTVSQIGFPQYISGYQQALRYVVKLRVEIPNGITVNLYTLTLKQKTSPTIEVHHGGADPGVITGIVDGKQGLFLSTGPRRYGGSVIDSRWGWPGIRLMSGPIFGYYSSTIRELATEINLQEGWTGTELSQPAHGRGNYVSDLQEVFGSSAGSSLVSRRHYGSAEFSTNIEFDLDLFCNLGNAVEPLVFNPDTFMAVSTQVALEGSDPDTSVVNNRDESHSDAKGAVQLQMTREEPYIIFTNQEVTGPHTYTGGSVMGTMDFPSLYGTAEAGGGNPWIVTSSDLDSFVAIIKDGALQCARERGAETDWKYFHVATGISDPSIARNEKNKDNPIYIAGHITGPPKKVLLLRNTTYGDTSGLWKIKVVAEGSHGFVQVEESLGLVYISYWRDGNFYLKRSSDEGATWLKWGDEGSDETLIKSGVPEQHFTFDFLATDGRELIGVYTDSGGNLQTLHSRVTLGDAWVA